MNSTKESSDSTGSNSDSDSDHQESEYTSSDSAGSAGSASSETSLISIESFSGDLKQLRKIVASINSTIETLETQLISIQRPIQSLHVDQLGDIPFLQSSPFRHTMLKFKSNVFPGLDPNQRYSFSDILKHVRTYLFEQKAVQPDGNIKLTKQMRKMFGIKESVVSYVDIMNTIRQIVY